MKKIRIDIEFKRLPQKKETLYSKIYPTTDPNYYSIVIDPRFSLLLQACSAVHELIHLVFYVFFKNDRIDEEKEHIVVEKTEASFKRHIKKYWGE